MNHLLQVLMYFFEKIQTEKPHLPSDKQVASDLKKLGLSLEKINHTINCIQNLADSVPLIGDYTLQPHEGDRVFDAFESTRLTRQSRSLILKLEQIGILNSETREHIIEQALRLETHPISTSHVKWIALMVLSEQPDKIPVAYMERLLLTEKKEQLH